MAHRVLLMTLVAGLLCPSVAPANGNNTHVGINLQAIKHLPPGALRELVLAPSLRQMLLNGSIFPDGGYAIGHGYGEHAHWEPTQRSLAKGLQSTCPGLPGADPCRQRLAFLLGMTGHGMADQVFDSLFMQAAKKHDKDGWASGTFDSLDSASDALWAAYVAPAPALELWLAMPWLMAAFAERGVKVEEATIKNGQMLLVDAVLSWGRNVGSQPDKVAAFEKQYPWSAAHLTDPHTAGSPPCEARVVASYWRHLWAEWVDLQERSIEVMATVPSDGGGGLASDPGDPASTAALIFSRGVNEESVKAELIEVRDAEGALLPAKLHLFYGPNDAHVLRIRPTEPWPEGTMSVAVLPGALLSSDGVEFDKETRFKVVVGPPNEVPPCKPPPGWSLAPAPSTTDGGQDDGDAGGCSASPAAGLKGSAVALLAGLLMLLLCPRTNVWYVGSLPP